MVDQICHEIEKNGGKARVLPVERLRSLKADIEAFGRTAELNGFQKYILSGMYEFDLPAADFPVRSVIVVATPGPAYAEVVFHQNGGAIRVKGLARYRPGGEPPQEAMGKCLRALLEPQGYHVAPAGTLPLKRLAVCSGLAEYGRNNVCYVDGMGSFITLSAFFTDVPCEGDGWRGVVQMDCCDGCGACLGNCPTGALRPDRFLIDNERCLSYFNEFPGEFPDWLPQSVHHCLYDCMMCQNVCPANAARMGDVIGPITFDVSETEALLAGAPLEELPAGLLERVRMLGMDQWFTAMPRNIAVLLDNARG